MNLDIATTEYLAFHRSTKAKSDLTLDKEASAFRRLTLAFGGEKDLGSVSLSDLRGYATSRAAHGVSNRTINLDILALANLIRHHTPTGEIVTDHWKPLKHVTPKRTLMPEDALTRLMAEATRKKDDGTSVYESGQMLVDFLLLLAFSGCRKTAALTLTWDNVDFENRRVIFHTKFDKVLTLPFNRQLEQHLRSLHQRSLSDPIYTVGRLAGQTAWVFPGKHGDHRKDLDYVFTAVRDMAGLSEFTFHDFRHRFASVCVMSGIDFMTVAHMLGHSDGGTLVAKVYGHLTDTHLRKAAAKLKL